jgi:hypothetical protein
MIGIGYGAQMWEQAKQRHEELLCQAEARRQLKQAGLQQPSLARYAALRVSRLLIWAGSWLKERYAAGSPSSEFGMAGAPLDR